LAVVIVDLIGFGIVMPILPFWASELGASSTTYGLILSSYAAAQFVCSPLWGALSDRIGRRRVLLTTVAGTAGALALLAFAESLWLVFAARILAGAFAGNIGVASAYITDLTPPEQRTGKLALIGLCFAVGFSIGPALAWPLAALGPHAPLWFAAALAALNWIAAFAFLREPARIERGAASSESLRFGALADPRVRTLALANLAFSLAVTQLESMFPLFMKDEFSYTEREFVPLLLAMALVMGVVQGGMRRIVPRVGEARLALFGCAALALAFAAIPEMPGVGSLLLPLALSAIGRALAQPSMLGLVSLAATPESRGQVMGTFQSMASLARVFGPAAAGALYAAETALPFWLAGALCAGLLFVPWRGLARELGESPNASPNS
jgi:MFS family permease